MKVFSFIALTLLTTVATAQDLINYKIVADEPRKINNFSCNIDLAGMDFGLGNVDGTSFNLGVWGHAMYQQKLGIDYSYRYGWLTLGKFASSSVKNHVNLQTGGFFIFNSNAAMTTNKVILKQNQEIRNGKTYNVTEFLKVPSQKWRYKALRAGIYFDRGAGRIEVSSGPDTFFNFYTLGGYAGICFGSSRHVIIQTDKHGAKGVVSHLRVCFDVLVTPVNNVPAGVKNTIPVGGRLLVQALPTLRKKDKGKKAYRTKMTAEFEIGYRMVSGLYFGGTLSIPISRSIKSFQTEGESQQIKRTTE